MWARCRTRPTPSELVLRLSPGFISAGPLPYHSCRGFQVDVPRWKEAWKDPRAFETSCRLQVGAVRLIQRT